MTDHTVVHTIFLIFAGAAVLATLALFARQAMIIAYIVMGALVGPAGLGWVADAKLVSGIADIGIIFLLYLLGLSLLPQKLMHMLRQATMLTVLSSLAFAAIGMLVAAAFGLAWLDALVVGATMMFSSTILGLKLLPTTALHHRHAGEIVISVLLIQDVIAILILLMLQSTGTAIGWGLLRILVALPGLVLAALMAERYLLRPLLLRFDTIQEYVFLVAIGWCLTVAQLAEWLSLSYEIGAFIAGVALAASPIARFIAESLRPIRDFFLVLFFFTVGAGFDWEVTRQILLPASILAILMLLCKPLLFNGLLRRQGENSKLAWEMGVRLGQISEFSLLIAAVALETAVVQTRTAYLIHMATLLSFVASSYWIVLRYPTPIATSSALRRD